MPTHRANGSKIGRAMRYEVHGSGPYLFIGYPLRANGKRATDNAATGVRDRYLVQLTSRYRVVIMDYPPTGEEAQAVVDSLTPERVSADILEVADAVGADRFAWYGYSWGGVVGLQLAAKSSRLTALICGGWPPLGAPYQEMVFWSERVAERTGLPDWAMTVTYYRGLLTWAEREAVASISCPRMAFAGSDDVIVSEVTTFPIGPLLAEHRAELEEMGWTVQLIDGQRHDLFMQPDVVVPLVRGFLDPILLGA